MIRNDNTSAGAVRSGVLTATLGMAIGAAFAAHPALAEETAPGDQITVTGQREEDANPNADPNAAYKVDKSANGKFTEPVRDTPKSITIVPKEVLEDTGVTSFRDLARSTPGVTLGTGEGGNAFGDRIFIRGFEARNDVYIDGLRDPGVSSREIFAVEQVEIVKGPSSTYGGRGTTGGAVSLQSKRPSATSFLKAEEIVGTDKLSRTTIDANWRPNDAVGIRVNGLYHTGDTPGRDHVDGERWGAAIAAEIKPIDTATLIFDYYHARLDGMSDYGHPWDPAIAGPADVDPDNFYGAVGRDFLKGGADVGTFGLDMDLADWLTFSSRTRYGKVTNQYVVSVPRPPVKTNPDPSKWTVATGSPQRNAATTAALHASSLTAKFATGGISHAIVGGFEYSDEKIVNRRYAFPAFVETGSGTQLPVSGGFTLNYLKPNPVLGYNIPALIDPNFVPTRTSVENTGFYLVDTIKLTPQFEAVLGARHDAFKIATQTAAGKFASDVDFWNWQASLVYKPIEAISLYGSWSTSSNPSGEQLDATSPIYGGVVGAQTLQPERNESIELGAKWEVGNVLLTAAAFRIDKDNAREQVAPNVFALVGQLRSDGLEFGINGNITPRLAVFGGYTYLDATVRNSTNAALDGAQFANVPKHNLSMLATYAFSDEFSVGGQAYYRSRIYGGDFGANANSVPGYWKFDATARYRFSDDIEVRANVLNLTDKRYYDAIYRSGTPFVYVAPGRSATLSLAVTF